MNFFFINKQSSAILRDTVVQIVNFRTTFYTAWKFLQIFKVCDEFKRLKSLNSLIQPSEKQGKKQQTAKANDIYIPVKPKLFIGNNTKVINGSPDWDLTPDTIPVLKKPHHSCPFLSYGEQINSSPKLKKIWVCTDFSLSPPTTYSKINGKNDLISRLLWAYSSKKQQSHHVVPQLLTLVK